MKRVLCLCFISTVFACVNERFEHAEGAASQCAGLTDEALEDCVNFHVEGPLPPKCAGKSGEALEDCRTSIKYQLRDDSPAWKFGPIQSPADFNARVFQYRNEVIELQTGRMPEYKDGVSVETINQAVQPMPPPSAVPSASR